MSTAQTAAAPAPRRTFDVSSTSPVPFLRLAKVEMRKMADTLAGKWLLGIIALINIAMVVLIYAFSPAEDRTMVNFLGSTTMIQTYLIPVFGILLVTGEWGQRTTLTTFTLEPSRLRLMAAKTVAAIAYALLALLITLVVAGLAAIVGGSSDPWDSLTSVLIANLALIQVVSILQGVAFGALLLNSAAAIVLFFVVPQVVTIVSNVWSAFRDFGPWIDLQAARLMLMDFEWVSGEAWAHLGVASLIWIVLPLVLGLVRIVRMELK